MKEYPSTEELRATFDYVDGCLYWKIKPAMCIFVGDKAGTPKSIWAIIEQKKKH